jgi:predicted aconitase with swiveling domain
MALGLVAGTASGPVAGSTSPVSVARIDPCDGILREPGHALDGRCLAGTVLVCPTGKGSSSGSYVLLNLAKRGLAPTAIVVRQADAVLVAGAVMAEIPLISGLSAEEFDTCLHAAVITVDGGQGRVTPR